MRRLLLLAVTCLIAGTTTAQTRTWSYDRTFGNDNLGGAVEGRILLENSPTRKRVDIDGEIEARILRGRLEIADLDVLADTGRPAPNALPATVRLRFTLQGNRLLNENYPASTRIFNRSRTISAFPGGPPTAVYWFGFGSITLSVDAGVGANANATVGVGGAGSGANAFINGQSNVWAYGASGVGISVFWSFVVLVVDAEYGRSGLHGSASASASGFAGNIDHVMRELVVNLHVIWGYWVSVTFFARYPVVVGTETLSYVETPLQRRRLFTF